MNRMMKTSTTICRATAPGIGLEELVGDAERQRPRERSQRLPTPPNTTTMKLSMM